MDPGINETGCRKPADGVGLRGSENLQRVSWFACAYLRQPTCEQALACNVKHASFHTWEGEFEKS